LRSHEDIDKKVEPGDFPCMVESHLPGKEFSCEAFIHNGKVRFLNITEYVRLGYSNFIPCGAELEAKRPLIEKEINKLVKSFGIEYGMIHPEWFLTENDELAFGEVACRIPGGHILDLVSKSYEFDALAAFVVCHDPNATEEDLDAVFPPKDFKVNNYHGNVMIYPQRGQISKLVVPQELLEEPYFEDHTLVPPVAEQKIGDREGYGNHFGTVNFRGPDPKRIKELLQHYENVPFYA